MKRLTNNLRSELLELLKLDRGHAGEAHPLSPNTFYPIHEHLEALDPSIVFVVGPRGSGKSKLVEAITNNSIRAALVKVVKVDLPRDGGRWVVGHPYQSQGPSNRAWQNFGEKAGHDHSRLQTLWLGLLVRSLKDELTADDQRALAPILDAAGSDAKAIHEATTNSIDQVERRLDALDASLLRDDRSLFVAYDELDTLYFTDWLVMLQVLRGLTAMWAGYYRRWRRLRPKLFVRTDLFEEQHGLMTSDVAKMAARRVDLHWSDRNLYGALFKQIIHRNNRLLEYFEPSLTLTISKAFGKTPEFDNVRAIDPAVKRLCGEYMGANKNKGFSRTWLLNSIRDGAGRASPRNLIQLVEKAADLEHDQLRAIKSASQLLHHVSLRNALTTVSEDHVRDAMSNEHPWLAGFRSRLQTPLKAREVPWARKDLEAYLAVDWDKPWSDLGDRPRPPAKTPAELIERLVRLGVLRERKDGSLDAPNLYLEGLGLFRRGGVAKT